MAGATSDFDRQELKTRWVKLLSDAVENDGWGQIVEAADCYDKLQASVARAAKRTDIAPVDVSALSKVQLVAQLRMRTLKEPGFSGVPLDVLKRFRAVLDAVFTDASVIPIPVDLSMWDKQRETLGLGASPFAPVTMGGTLLGPPPGLGAGETFIAVFLDRIGLKDAQSNYVNPFITVSVMDGATAVERSQDTPALTKRIPQYVLIQHTIHIQTPLSKLGRDATIFFEFKHYKQRRVSTRCWCMLEMDELKPGPLALEVYVSGAVSYRKPTDLQKKNIQLFSVKKLYLQCTVSLIKS